MKVVCKVGKSWLEGVVTKINEKVTREGIFLDDNGDEMKTEFLFGKVIQVTFEYSPLVSQGMTINV
jgi:hypothetical protein